MSYSLDDTLSAFRDEVLDCSLSGGTVLVTSHIPDIAKCVVLLLTTSTAVIYNSNYADMKDRINTIERCPECKNESMTTDAGSGEVLCSQCGMVIMESFSEQIYKQRPFINNESPNGAGIGPPTSLAMHDMGLGTKINTSDKDSSGNPIKATMKFTIWKLRMYDGKSQSRTLTNRKFGRAFIEMNRLKNKLSVSNTVMDRAAYLYRKAYEMGLVKGKRISHTVAAIVYIACRDTNTMRTLKDVGKAASIKHNEIGRYYNRLVVEMDLCMQASDTTKYIAMIASRMNIPEITRRRAIVLLNKARNKGGLSDKSPMGLAATVLYIACIKNGKPMTQQNIAKAAGIGEHTIQKTYYDFVKFVDI